MLVRVEEVMLCTQSRILLLCMVCASRYLQHMMHIFQPCMLCIVQVAHMSDCARVGAGD